MKSIDSTETYPYGTSKDIISLKEKIRRCNIMQRYLTSMKDVKEYNPNWPEILDHPYRILVIRDSGSWKTIALLNLINHEPDINETYSFEAKYQFLINKW